VALQQAKITLQEAVVTAQKEIAGGRVIDADVGTVKGGKIGYAIKILKDGEHIVRVDLQSGVIISKTSRRISPKDWKEMAELEGAKVTLAEALITAEKEMPGGRIMSAGVKEERRRTRYQIEIEKDGPHVVEIDPEDGRVLRVKRELDD
jgi:uncharacterized membrane protein YkoI